MARICLVSCVSAKVAGPVPAADLYTSPLFRKARQYAQGRADRWFILSAKHGLLRPDASVESYEQTLNIMPVDERRAWANRVLDDLLPALRPGDTLTILAGHRYREFLVPPLKSAGVVVDVPMDGLSIGRQLQWLNVMTTNADPRPESLDRFYALLDELAGETGGPRPLCECRSDGWPARGVYFFFEPGEVRAADPSRQRVVRVGTHAVSTGSKSTLWGRLRQHRGNAGGDGGGNHRGSIFRLHVGAALLRRQVDAPGVPTWGDKQTGSRTVRDAERPTEQQVSAYLGRLSVLAVGVDDAPGRESDRARIERGAIALLCGPDGPADPSSPGWLGRSSPRDEIRRSGLWNLNHVGDRYDPAFLDTLGRYVRSAKATQPTACPPS